MLQAILHRSSALPSLAALALMALLTASGARAACENAVTTCDMQACYAGLFRKAEYDLNLVWNTLISRTPGSERERLREAQRQWLRYRELDCRNAAGQGSGRGSISGLEHVVCMTERTLARVDQIRAQLGN